MFSPIIIPRDFLIYVGTTVPCFLFNCCDCKKIT